MIKIACLVLSLALFVQSRSIQMQSSSGPGGSFTSINPGSGPGWSSWSPSGTFNSVSYSDPGYQYQGAQSGTGTPTETVNAMTYSAPGYQYQGSQSGTGTPTGTSVS